MYFGMGCPPLVHSMALTDDGALFYWTSSDPDLRCRQHYPLSGKKLVSVSAGKYWTSAVTNTGEVYTWDGKNGKDKAPGATRLHGIKKATSASVGETHLLLVGSLYHPTFPTNDSQIPQKMNSGVSDELTELDEDFMFTDTESHISHSSVQKDDAGTRPFPSLKSLCEKWQHNVWWIHGMLYNYLILLLLLEERI